MLVVQDQTILFLSQTPQGRLRGNKEKTKSLYAKFRSGALLDVAGGQKKTTEDMNGHNQSFRGKT